MSYSIKVIDHPEYKQLISIVRDDNGEHSTPFQIYNVALLKRRELLLDNPSVRFIVDDQILTPKQLENWSNQEYLV